MGSAEPQHAPFRSIAVRSVIGITIKIPKGLPRMYDLPDEVTVRLALMQTPHEVRGLLMAYGALRLGEACAATGKDLDGIRLHVARQVVEVWQPEGKTLLTLGPVKAGVGTVVLPTGWLNGWGTWKARRSPATSSWRRSTNSAVRAVRAT